MSKEYTSLGLMSGTSGDGIDASLIKSDGKTQYKVILDKYFKYNNDIYKEIHSLKDLIKNKTDLTKQFERINELEKKITLFHAKVAIEIIEDNNVDIVGFHGQTIYHNAQEKISKQLGDAHLLAHLCKKDIIYNFRQNDIINGGQGAPLAPIFHQLINKQHTIDTPICFLNIGGISNLTILNSNRDYDFESRDIGPGNCLIDEWIRKNNKKNYDAGGLLAAKGFVNEIILETATELYSYMPKQKTLSLDVKDFDVSFARGLSLIDGAATITEFTGRIISSALNLLSKKKEGKFFLKVLLCGGGRNNNTLIASIKKNVAKNIHLQNIDEYQINGDFIESQAFGYLAIRSYLKIPISFPKTTGCTKPISGGEIIKY